MKTKEISVRTSTDPWLILKPGHRDSIGSIARYGSQKTTGNKYRNRGEHFRHLADLFLSATNETTGEKLFAIGSTADIKVFDEWAATTPDKEAQKNELGQYPPLNPYYNAWQNAAEGLEKVALWHKHIDRRTRLRKRIDAAGRRNDRQTTRQFALTIERAKGIPVENPDGTVQKDEDGNVVKNHLPTRLRIIGMQELLTQSIEDARQHLANILYLVIERAEYDLYTLGFDPDEMPGVETLKAQIEGLDTLMTSQLRQIKTTVQGLWKQAEKEKSRRYDTTVGLALLDSSQH